MSRKAVMGFFKLGDVENPFARETVNYVQICIIKAL
jgi:hypothetical protein